MLQASDSDGLPISRAGYPTESEPKVLPVFLALPPIAAGFAVCIGLFVLLGWAFDLERLKRVVPGFVAMNSATAVLFILAGIGFGMALRYHSSGLADGARKILAMIIIIVAVLKLLDAGGLWHSGVDEVFFTSRLWDSQNELPNRMAPNTACNFVLLGVSMLILNVRGRRSGSQALAIVIGFGALLPITGYAFGVRSFSGLAAFIPMALHTAVTFLVLAAGLFFANPDAPITEPFTTSDPRGVLSRRLLPFAVFLTLFLGWARLWGERHGFYESAFGTVLYALTLSVLFVILVRWTVATIGKLEVERAAMNFRLHELNRRKDEMIAVVSHDLCSPLTGFRMVIDLLREKQEEPSDELLGIMDHSARRMVSMVRGLLDISKLQADKVELELEDVRVSELIRASMEPLAINAKAKHIRLELHVAEGEPIVRADPLRLSQVFSNLLINAVKFTPNDGAVDVTVEPRDKGVQVNVRDTGLGIPMAEVPHIFDSHRQTTTKATAGEAGAGLGLAIVRELVLMHGGQITVSSAVNRGSVFTVILPKNQ